MSVLIDIVPVEHTLHMFGEPDTDSAYSLSGHVSIALSSPYSLLHRRRRTARLILQSLTLTFDGQTEMVSPNMTYAPLRLCTVTRELVPSEQIELSNKDLEHSAWNVVFDLPIPGWLPSTSSFGLDDDAGTRYELHATAKFVNLAEDSVSSFLSVLCPPFRSSTRLSTARKLIVLKRFANPPSIPRSFSIVDYTVPSKPESVSDTADFPSHLFSNLEVVASLPRYVNAKEPSLSFAFRLRAPGLDQTDRKRFQLTGFSVQLDQSETYRRFPTPEYRTQFPIPPPSDQPPNKPLLCPHPMSVMGPLGFTPIHDKGFTVRSFSLLSNSQSEYYQLPGDQHIFDPNTDVESSWFTIESVLPFPNTRSTKDSHWGSPRRLRLSETGPLFSVSHEMHVSIDYLYDMPGRETKAAGKQEFSIPIRFVHIAPTPSLPLASPLIINTDPPTFSHTPSLPAYSQLFDSNGDRKIDYSVQLPRYSPFSTGLETARLLDSSSTEDHFSEQDPPCSR